MSRYTRSCCSLGSTGRQTSCTLAHESTTTRHSNKRIKNVHTHCSWEWYLDYLNTKKLTVSLFCLLIWQLPRVLNCNFTNFQCTSGFILVFSVVKNGLAPSHFIWRTLAPSRFIWRTPSLANCLCFSPHQWRECDCVVRVSSKRDNQNLNVCWPRTKQNPKRKRVDMLSELSCQCSWTLRLKLSWMVCGYSFPKS